MLPGICQRGRGTLSTLHRTVPALSPSLPPAQRRGLGRVLRAGAPGSFRGPERQQRGDRLHSAAPTGALGRGPRRGLGVLPRRGPAGGKARPRATEPGPIPEWTTCPGSPCGGAVPAVPAMLAARGAGAALRRALLHGAGSRRGGAAMAGDGGTGGGAGSLRGGAALGCVRRSRPGPTRGGGCCSRGRKRWRFGFGSAQRGGKRGSGVGSPSPAARTSPSLAVPAGARSTWWICAATPSRSPAPLCAVPWPGPPWGTTTTAKTPRSTVSARPAALAALSHSPGRAKGCAGEETYGAHTAVVQTFFPPLFCTFPLFRAAAAGCKDLGNGGCPFCTHGYNGKPHCR